MMRERYHKLSLKARDWWEPIALKIVRKIRITNPNDYTFLSVLSGLAGAFSIIGKHYIWALIFVILSQLGDMLDGPTARWSKKLYKIKRTKEQELKGYKIDYISDICVNSFLMFITLNFSLILIQSFSLVISIVTLLFNKHWILPSRYIVMIWILIQILY